MTSSPVCNGLSCFVLLCIYNHRKLLYYLIWKCNIIASILWLPPYGGAVSWGSWYSIWCNVLYWSMFVPFLWTLWGCPFELFLWAIDVPVLQLTDYDYPFSMFKNSFPVSVSESFFFNNSLWWFDVFMHITTACLLQSTEKSQIKDSSEQIRSNIHYTIGSNKL